VVRPYGWAGAVSEVFDYADKALLQFEALAELAVVPLVFRETATIAI
jgi:hypothetical protein